MNKKTFIRTEKSQYNSVKCHNAINNNKMKKEEYHIVGTISTSNRQVVKHRQNQYFKHETAQSPVFVSAPQ